MGPLGPTTRSRPPLRQRPRAPRLAEPASRQPRARNRWLGRAGRFPPGPTEGARIFMAKCASPNASRRVGAGRDGSRGCRRRSRALARADWPSAPPTILTMRCASLRRDGHPCYATATWARLHCPAHDPAMRRRPTGFPRSVRDRALELYQEVGPAETARRTGLRSGTIRAWASRAGVSSPHVPYEWARDVTTWPATIVAQERAKLRRLEREIAEMERALSFADRLLARR